MRTIYLPAGKVRVSVSVERATATGEDTGDGLIDARGIASDGVAAGFGDAVAVGPPAAGGSDRAAAPRALGFFFIATVNGAVARWTSQPCACNTRKRVAWFPGRGSSPGKT